MPKNAEVFPVDPLDTKTAWLLPWVYHTLLKIEETDQQDGPITEKEARTYTARVALGDPKILALAAVDEGKVVGATLLELQLLDGGERRVFCHKCYLEPGYPGVVDKMIQLADNWGMKQGAMTMYMEATPRHSVRSWGRRYGFRLVYYCMERDLGYGRQGKK